MDKKNRSQINFRIEPALKRQAEQAAEKEGRSLTKMLERLLFDHINGVQLKKRKANPDA